MLLRPLVRRGMRAWMRAAWTRSVVCAELSVGTKFMPAGRPTSPKSGTPVQIGLSPPERAARGHLGESLNALMKASNTETP